MGVLHLAENLSDHEPIYLKLITGKLERKEIHEVFHPKQNWKAATSNNKKLYKSNLKERLENIDISKDLSECKDIHCNNPDHKIALDNYTLDIIESMEKAVNDEIPYTNEKFKHKKIRPGWKEMVYPFKKESSFWYQLWLSAGKPRDGQLFQNMKLSKNQYKYARRRCENAMYVVKRDKLVEACENGGRDFFAEIKKLRGLNKNNCTTKMDGKDTPVDIADHLGNIWDTLYNKVGSSEPLKELLDEVNINCKDNFEQIKCRVMGKGGRTLKSMLKKSDITPSKTCWDPECPVCLTEGKGQYN